MEHLSTFLDAVLKLELELPPDDIRSNKFFHGKVSRLTTESLLIENGQFLVRESSSHPGQYVLSCRFTDAHLHFIIHEHHQSGSGGCEQLQFSFDGDKFNSVRELIAFHVNTKEPVTSVSGAVICQPVGRNLPLEANKLELYYHSHSQKPLDWLLKNIDLQHENVLDKIEVDGELQQADCTSFSSDYLKQIQRGVSAIQLEGKGEQEIFAYNGPAEASQLICDTGPGILASHLFKRNLAYLGIDFEQNLTQLGQSPLRSGIELMCLPVGKQMRCDIIIRHECLKYFVITTILRAPDMTTRSDILTKWIQVASKLFAVLGDYLGFGALMAGLCHPRIAKLNSLWQHLRLRQSNEVILYDTLLNAKFYNLLSARDPLAPNTTIPFVIQLCHLLECGSILNSKFQPMFSNMQLSDIVAVEEANHRTIGLSDFSLDKIITHIELSSGILDNLNLFERNAIVAFNGFFFKEPLLDELFKTTFQLKFLFGQDIDSVKLNHEIFRNLEDQLSHEELQLQL